MGEAPIPERPAGAAVRPFAIGAKRHIGIPNTVGKLGVLRIETTGVTNPQAGWTPPASIAQENSGLNGLEVDFLVRLVFQIGDRRIDDIVGTLWSQVTDNHFLRSPKCQ